MGVDENQKSAYIFKGLFIFTFFILIRILCLLCVVQFGAIENKDVGSPYLQHKQQT